MMEPQDVRRKIQLAKELIGTDDTGPFAIAAFQEVFRALLNGQQTQQKKGVQETTNAVSPAGQIPPSVSEFLAQKKPDNHTGRITTILYYLDRTGIDSATIADIDDAYGISRLKAPRNFSDAIGACIKKGYVIQARSDKDSKRSWQITRTGAGFVETELGISG